MNTADYQTFYQLNRACETGDIHRLKELLKENPLLVKQTYNPFITTTPYETAIVNNQIEIVKYLIETGIPLPETSLFYTSSKEMYQFLLKFKEDFETSEWVSAACRFGDLPLLQEFFQNKSILAQILQQKPNFMKTAILFNKLNIVKYLIDLGFPIPGHAIYWVRSKEMLEFLLAHGATYDREDLLYKACSYGMITLLKQLLEEDEQLIHYYIKNNTKFFEAVISNDHIKMAKYFIELGVPIPEKGLLEAKSKDMVQLLIEHGASYEVQDSLFRETPLHKYAKAGNTEAVKVLVQHGANLDVENVKGENPLHLAARSGNIETARYLLDQGMSVHSKDVKGNTPLHLAMQSKSKEMIDLLIEYGADIQRRNHSGEMPHHTVSQDHPLYDYVNEKVEQLANPYAAGELQPHLLHLHPTKEELLAILPQAGIAKRYFQSKPEWIERIQTDLPHIRDISISPDGKWVALVSSHIRGIQIRDYETLQVVKTLEHEYNSFHCVQFASNGKWIFADGWYYDLNQNTWQCIDEIRDIQEGRGDISPDSNTIAIVYRDDYGDVLVLLYVKPKKWADLAYNSKGGPLGEIHDVCFSPDSKMVAFYDEVDVDKIGQLVVASNEDDQEIWRVTVENPITSRFDRPLRKVHFTETDVICTAGKYIIFCDPGTGEIKRKWMADPDHEIQDMVVDDRRKRCWIIVNNKIKWIEYEQQS
ncbi:ankyrin repeat domain-containing protein [Thermoflavimicrobium dichotomicum]|uniref:Ankyrin repeat-containing protein n=1 Tax=Thermoflavimicrobium dichotomicum TaxID=46223 RepID=A0A1I3UB90_9BACL|nr:ankyrin repeat domain-containing protein [Thermoflavimicrobium dichotomicum]SFJ79889.1 Ankyrin repeat-containing protein [Thermoflavimicrobium dichotomicum]